MGMAKIVPSELAPDEEITYALGGSKPFKLDGSGSHETDSPELISNARAHPWLDVEVDPEESVEPLFRTGSLPYEDDALSAANSVANDPKLVEDARREAVLLVEDRTAIESGKDQEKVIEVGDVAVTLAADDAQDSDNDTSKGTRK